MWDVKGGVEDVVQEAHDDKVRERERRRGYGEEEEETIDNRGRLLCQK